MFKKITSLFIVLFYCVNSFCLPSSAEDSNKDIPEDAFEFQQHYYKVYDEVCDTWDEAKVFCEELGGHLATINYEEENKMLYSYIVSCGYTNAYFGYTDNLKEGDWNWVTDEDIGYTNWSSGEPNNSGNEDYAMFYWKFTDGTWNDGNFGNGTVNDQKVFICEWDDSSSNKKPSKSIAVFTTERTFSISMSESMYLGFGIIENGLLDEKWQQMALTVSDSTVISLSEYEKNEYGYSVEIKGLKEGFSNLTITDTKSGLCKIIVISVYDKYVKNYSYSIEDIATFYPNNKWENDIATNIYNLNGLYVNNYRSEFKNGEYLVSFDVYNSRYYAGAVDVYDANGMWIGYEEIEKYKDMTSIWDTGEQILYLADSDAFLTYKQGSFSKHTSITNVKVPEGGFFTISNNVASSPGTFFINALEILFDGAYASLDLFTSNSVQDAALIEFKKSAAKSFTDNLIEARNEGLKDTIKKESQKVMLDTMKSEIEEITKNFVNAESKDKLSLTDDMCSQMANLAENILVAYDISWKHLFKSVTGVGESFFTSFAGPAGVVLKGFFEVNEATNKLLMITQMAMSTKNVYATVYTSIEEGVINPHGVIVNTSGNMDAEAVLQVFKVSNDELVEVILNSDDSLENYELYNICFVKDDKHVQPNGMVTVNIPIPKGMTGNTCKVYRQEDDGSWTILDARIEGNYLVFETYHFSYYAVVGSESEINIATMPKKVKYQVGDALNVEGLTIEVDGKSISGGFICSPTVLSEKGTQKITLNYAGIETTFDVTVTDAAAIDKDKLSTSEDNGFLKDNFIIIIIIIVGVAVLLIIIMLIIAIAVRKKMQKNSDADEAAAVVPDDISSEKEISNRYCTKCGAELQRDMLFCNKCGNRIE